MVRQELKTDQPPAGLILGVIPARGGSKRVPRKNLVFLLGKPLISYTIEAALGSKLLTRILVSTEDEEIRETALQYGADAPFVRPAELAADSAKTSDVAIHALLSAEKMDGRQYSYVCVLEPTSPLRTSQDIDSALALFQKNADSVIGLTPVEFGNPGRLRVIRKGRVARLFPEQSRPGQPAQQLEPVYMPGGGIFAAQRDLLVGQKTLCGPRQAGFILPRDRGLDIDTPEDIALAEFFLQRGAQEAIIPTATPRREKASR